MRYNLLTKLAVSVALLVTVSAAVADDLDKLITDAASQDKEVCLPAIDKLGKADDSAKAVPALVQALSRDDEDVQSRAARALGAIGPDASAAGPALAKALESDAPKVRAYAAFALGKIGDKSSAVVDGLIKTAFDTEVLVRRASLKALREIDPPQEKSLPVVLKILEEGDPAVVMAAMLTLAEEGETVVPRLCKALENEQACYWACLVLAEIGPEAKEAVPQLKAVLKHEQPETRLQAVAALGEIGPAAKPLTADIVALLENDPFGGVRYAAAFALGKIGTDAGATAALNKAVDKGDAFLKLLSAWALARNNPDDKASVKRAVDLIVQAFKSDDAGLRRAAAKAAVDFDVSLDVVAPMLIDALGDEDQSVVKNAIESLAELGPKALKHIDKLFERDELRFYPIALITRLGPEATDAVPALIEVLGIQHATDEDAMFLREIQFAVAAIGPGAKGAVRALADNLDSRNHEVVASASYALGKIGPAARAAVPALRRNLRHEKLIVKLATVRALLEILPDQRQVGPSAIPLLAQGLEHENEYVRAECATALGEIGSPARKALAALKGLLEDESEIVRKAAAEAIEKIE